ncbi:hypothetical protein KSP40_PGU007870 [Platanthera guangdongensis]|uniref:F-box domain-containing protein n=1 Tax=Platanthera guangdongensis TaxID=2320717 RepID=A0ABR2LDP3_9ASPA
MAERGGGNLLERLGPDLSAAVLLRMEDPADLVRSASVSHSWRRFVIANRFCKMLCLRMAPEISCFVRAVEAGSFSDHVKVHCKCSVQLEILESEHKIYAYLGFRLVSLRFLKELTLQPIVFSDTADRMENMQQNIIVRNMNFSFSSSRRQFLQTYKLVADFCVVHEIKVHPIIDITYSTIMYKPRTLCFRLGHLRDENANHEESPEQNYNWTYVSTEFSLAQTVNVQSIKLPRSIICIGGLLQIELMSSGSPTDELFDKSIPKIEAIGHSLAPTLDVSGIRTGNLVLMYFPGLAGDGQHASYSRSKFINGLKRRRNRR